MNFIQLLQTEHKALIIQGKQGSGKTLLAKQLAPNAVVVLPEQLLTVSPYSKVIIVEECTLDASFLANIKPRIFSDVVIYKQKNGELTYAPAPFFILCTSDLNTVQDRRFAVLKIAGGLSLGAAIENAAECLGEGQVLNIAVERHGYSVNLVIDGDEPNKFDGEDIVDEIEMAVAFAVDMQQP